MTEPKKKKKIKKEVPELTEEQISSLLSQFNLDSRVHEIALNAIEDPNIEAPNYLLASLKHMSQQQPVFLQHGDGPYKIVDGRRRISALIELDKETVRAFLLPKDLSPDILPVLTLTTNLARSSNPSAEAKAVADLLDRGWTEDSIVKNLGLDRHTVQQLISLKKRLHSKAFSRLTSGTLSKAAAQQLTKLPKTEQEKVIAEEKVRIKDVNAAVRAQSLSMSLPGSVQIPDIDDLIDLAAKIESVAMRYAGNNRTVLNSAAAILRTKPEKSEE